MEQYSSDDKQLLSEIYELITFNGYKLKTHSMGVSIGRDKSSHTDWLTLMDVGRNRHYQILDIIESFDIEIGYVEAQSALEDQGDVDSAIIELRKLRG